MTSITTERRAILFRIGGIGDLLVALPALALARRALPGHRLTLVGRAEHASLIRRAGIVDESMPFDDPRMAVLFDKEFAPGREPKAGNGRRQPPGISCLGSIDGPAAAAENGVRPPLNGSDSRGPGDGLLTGFDIAAGWWNRSIDWPADEWWARQGVGRTCFIAYDGSSGQPISRYFFDRTINFFGRSSSAARSIASDDHEKSIVPGASGEARAGRQESAKGSRAGSSNLNAVSNESELFDDCARLTLPAALIKKALDDLGLYEFKPGEKRLVVHPGSGGRAKRWPLPNFIEVVRRAASLGLHGVLVTGEAEEDLEPSLKALALPPGWTRVSRLPAETLAGLVASSTHYIGNDSGPTHLAAACGARVLAFFRDDNLPAWRPFGRTRILSAPDLASITLAAALPVVDDFLAS